ncbi:MAG: hypothetical protein HY286_05795 [Planctomycetes bacterium]|nr:hypothetical protein [Planctomycetota bacterium]
MAAAPQRRGAPPSPPKPFPVVQLVLILVMSVASIGMIIFLMKEDPKPVPKVESVPASKPASKPVAPPSTIKSIPADVRAELYASLTKYSDQVDPLEKAEAKADDIADSGKRFEEYERLTDLYAVNREAIGDIIEMPKYEKYRNDSAYGPEWQGFEGRMKYWQNKMNSIKKKRDRAFNEMQAAKAATENKKQ